MAHIKRSVVELKAENNCLAHALIIVIAKVKNDSIYKSYYDGYKIRPVVANLVDTTGIDLSGGERSLNSSDLKNFSGTLK